MHSGQSETNQRRLLSSIWAKLLVFIIVWIVLTAIGSASGIVVWVYNIDGMARVLGNAAYIMALPGWVALRVFGFFGIRSSIPGIIVAHALSWFFWCSCFVIACSVRTWLVHRQASTEISSKPADEPINLKRRAFLGNAAVGGVTLGGLATPGYATLIEPWEIKVRQYTVPIKDLDPRLDGLRLVQMADTHLGPRIPESFVASAVDLVIAQRPDLVLLTGDHVHDGAEEIERAARLCKPLVEHAKIGVVGVLGNHDWWADGPKVSNELASQGVQMIDNNRVWIDPQDRSITHRDPGEGGLAIVGVGDLDEDVINIERAFRGVDPQTPRLLLSHNPDVAEVHMLIKPGSARVDLMCSGHTHGGQIRIPLIGTPIVPSVHGSKYAGGLVDGPAFPVHISRGVGMSVLPVRVGVPPEISVITLTRATNQ